MNHWSKQDLTGQRYSKLLVLKRTERVRSGRYKWLCRCDCGSEVEVYNDSLRTGNTKSCGCLVKEAAYQRGANLTGMVFSRLTVIKRSEKIGANKQKYWTCYCECGIIKDVAQAALTGQKTLSCGCYNKECVSKRTTTHGKSKTNAYWEMANRKRREARYVLDSSWSLEMENVLKEIQDYCGICGSTSRLSVDHVYPLSKGYGLKPGNVIILCRKCNSAKNNKLLETLPEDTQEKIKIAATTFQQVWEALNIVET